MINIFKYTAAKQFVHSVEVDPKLTRIAPGDWLWVDLEEPTADEEKILRQGFDFHPLVVDDCLVDTQYPKIDIYPDYLYIVLHGVNYAIQAQHFETAEVDIILGRNFLITHHYHKMRSVAMVRERVVKDPVYMERGSDMILYTILDKMVDHYFPDLQKIEDRIDEMEEQVFSNPQPGQLHQIFEVKKDVLHLKRILYPQREVFNRLSRDEFEFIQRHTRLYFRDIYDNISQLTEIADGYRDALSGLVDGYLSSVSNTLNQTMKILTIITTIFVPLTFVAGIYGMNFDHMPELRWRYGYYFALGVMLLISLGLLYFFRRKRWL